MDTDVSKISLKNFLKTYTAISHTFINEYYKFYEMCDFDTFGINLEDVIIYLNIKKKKRFYLRFKQKYIEGLNYITILNNKQKRSGVKVKEYFITLDTFETICMASKSEKSNEVRDYFITLRKFINYYKNNISTMIINNANQNPTKCVYIILVNKNKQIFKFGKTKNIRQRLYVYSSGLDKHPDIKFIMTVDDPKLIEKCVRNILMHGNKHVIKYRKEIYQVNIDIIKNAIFDCAITQQKYTNLFDDKKHDAYIIFDDSEYVQKRTNSSKRKSSKRKSSKR